MARSTITQHRRREQGGEGGERAGGEVLDRARRSASRLRRSAALRRRRSRAVLAHPDLVVGALELRGALAQPRAAVGALGHVGAHLRAAALADDAQLGPGHERSIAYRAAHGQPRLRTARRDDLGDQPAQVAGRARGSRAGGGRRSRCRAGPRPPRARRGSRARRRARRASRAGRGPSRGAATCSPRRKSTSLPSMPRQAARILLSSISSDGYSTSGSSSS